MKVFIGLVLASLILVTGSVTLRPDEAGAIPNWNDTFVPPPGAQSGQTVCRIIRNPTRTMYSECVQCCIVVDTTHGPVTVLCQWPTQCNSPNPPVLP